MDKNNLPLGTPVVLTGGPYPGWKAKVVRSYTIRFGHRMYDLQSDFGYSLDYYAPSQLEVYEEKV